MMTSEETRSIGGRPQARDDTAWAETNYRQFLSALARVEAALSRAVNRSSGVDGLPEPTVVSDNPVYPGIRGESGASALEHLCSTFRLSPFERQLLLLCAGVECNSRFLLLCGSLLGRPGGARPTFGLALSVFPDGHWSALSPVSPLRRWDLIHVEAGDSLATSTLRIDERIFDYLVGVSHLDRRLSEVISPVTVIPNPVPSHRELCRQIAAHWSTAPVSSPPLALRIVGHDREAVRTVAAMACRLLGRSLLVVAAGSLPAQPAEAGIFVRLWDREVRLFSSVLLIELYDLDQLDYLHRNTVSRLLEQSPGSVILAGATRQDVLDRSLLTLELAPPTFDEQIRLWEESLEANDTSGSHVEHLVSQFNLGANTIRSVAAEVREKRTVTGTDDSFDLPTMAWEAARRRIQPRFDGLAARIEPSAAWDDLILPETQKEIIREMATHVRHQVTVYRHWDFQSKGQRGLGISALFSGPSGTGKTMAAEVLASELRLDLYRIDLSSVVSKYIGETEKNLNRVFNAADEGGVMLLFDEADALFGKRSEVKDARDRYANIEVSYLLQRMESYRGLAILTTNLKSALDQAFLRRIRFVVQFPFPDPAQRAEIWQRVFPAATPTKGLDYDRLARLTVTGGNIRSIALNSAFLAADAGEPVQMKHILRAARTEYAKLEKTLTDAEVFDWI